MVLFSDYFTALVLCSLTAFLPTQLCDAAEQPCEFVLNDADYGVVQPTVETLVCNVCSWRIRASSERKLVINLDRVYLFNENASLSITIDGNETTYSNISCDEWEHKRLIGNDLQIVYRRPIAIKENGVYPKNSAVLNSSFKFANFTALPEECNTTRFEITYKSFDPLECEAPANPVNGFAITGKTRRVGEKVKYQCHTPFLLEKSSLSTATCVLNSKVPSLPSWSNPPPTCILPECGKMPIKIPLDSSQNKIILKLENSEFGKLKNCVWEIMSEKNEYLVVQIEHLNLPTYSTLEGKRQFGATLELYDNRISERRILAQLSGAMSSSKINYTTAFNKLVVTLRIGNSFAFAKKPQGDPTNEMEEEIRPYGFAIIVSAKVTLCQFPEAHVHGDIKGVGKTADVSKQEFNTEPGQAITFYCNSGFHLNGSENASCLGNGQWSEPVPPCVTSGILAEDTGSVSLEAQTVTMGSDTDVSEATEEAVLSGKTQQSRIIKDWRPHPQSTEEKTNLKAFKEDSNIKHSFVNPHATPSTETLTNFTGDGFSEDDQSSSGRVFTDLLSNVDEFDEGISNYDTMDDKGESESDFPEEDVVRDGGADSGEFPVIAIILGVGIPSILGIVAVAVFFVYRKLYPVRMNLGRKFETFENPAYGRGKRSPGTPLHGSLLPGASLAQSPAELQRLTAQTLP